MKFRMHTGPCWVNQIGAAVALVPGTRSVIIGTEHVLFEHDATQARDIYELALNDDRTRACWAYVRTMMKGGY